MLMTTAKYSMSFTTGALFYHESVKLADLYISMKRWDEVKNAVIVDNVIQARATNSLNRVTNEIISRLKTLSDPEIIFLHEADYSEQRHILWLSICRRYAFIADFAVDVVNDNFISLKNSVSYEDYNAFFSRKSEWHNELDRIAGSTKIKLRQTLFKMMREANLLDKNNSILPVVSSGAFRTILAGLNQKEAMFFPVSEQIR